MNWSVSLGEFWSLMIRSASGKTPASLWRARVHLKSPRIHDVRKASRSAAWKLDSKFIIYIRFSGQSTPTCQRKNPNSQTAILEHHVISRLPSEIRPSVVGRKRATNNNTGSERNVVCCAHRVFVIWASNHDCSIASSIVWTSKFYESLL